MAFVLLVASIIGFLLLALYAIVQCLTVSGLKEDLSAYLDVVEETVRMTGNPHYRAVESSLSEIYLKYFTRY